jgi:hypothetical protein
VIRHIFLEETNSLRAEARQERALRRPCSGLDPAWCRLRKHLLAQPAAASSRAELTRKAPCGSGTDRHRRGPRPRRRADYGSATPVLKH